VIGVIHKPDEAEIVREFFQLFKTPWEPARADRSYDVLVVSTDDLVPEGPHVLVRDKNFFADVRRLLTKGQSAEKALEPGLELKIKRLREAIVSGGIPLVEVLPSPAGHSFSVCLTHDIDFIGIRQHKCDHTMWGFLYRSTIGAVRELARGRIGVGRMMRMWKAAASLPFVQLGIARDFWQPFEWYLKVEQGIPATYFLIPFKGRAGEKVAAGHASRRATAYDVSDIPDWIATLKKQGCEVGVHGIDAWHSVEKGREELRRLGSDAGMRVHWLLANEQTPRTLEEAGYAYDSTMGYNETIGFRAGTTQVYLPPGNRSMLELPMHIQDGALFYPSYLGLSESAAWTLCQEVVCAAQEHGGVLTLLWHDRSHGPERFWGEFYERLVVHLKTLKVWFASGRQVVNWFRERRNVVFSDTELCHEGASIHPPF
jgi:hypothetical protein